MIHNTLNKLRFASYLMLTSLVFISCERELSDDVVDATFPSTADIYTDNPVGLTDEFFISFDPADGANPEAFDVDDNESYMGSSSIRIDVPSPDNPNGNFVGAIFRDRGEGRDLSGFDALTFWAKGSTTGTLSEVGFGTDFLDNKFPASRTGVQLTTDWQKYVVPIPDPSKLTQERGLFLFAAGGLDVVDDEPNGNEIGWTFWLDEIRFEKLGTSVLTKASVFNGQNVVQQGFVGSKIDVFGTTSSFNLSNGQNVDVNTSPGYFDFQSSEEAVATVSVEMGSAEISVIGSSGSSTITASLGNNEAEGSFEVTSSGNFLFAPTPPEREPSNVVSLFSDAYENEPVRHYNGFFLFATTQGGEGNDPNDVDIQFPRPEGGVDNIINYTELNFVSIGMYENVPFVDASNMTHLHLDINVRDESVATSDFIRLEIESNTGTGSPAGGSSTLTGPNLQPNDWRSFDIPLSNFSGNIDFGNVSQLFFVSDASISDIYVDNVYFYSE
jgi:hypothetical protein